MHKKEEENNSKDDFILNNFVTKRFGEDILVVTDQGSWKFLKKNESFRIEKCYNRQ